MLQLIFKFVFEFITNPLGLPIKWYYEYIILIFVGKIAFRIAYNAVGSMYNIDFIDGKTSGSFIHWTIRIGVFIIIWGLLYLIIMIFNYFGQ